jgi:hypothetical protein
LAAGWFPAAAEGFNHAGWFLMECAADFSSMAGIRLRVRLAGSTRTRTKLIPLKNPLFLRMSEDA